MTNVLVYKIDQIYQLFNELKKIRSFFLVKRVKGSIRHTPNESISNSKSPHVTIYSMKNICLVTNISTFNLVTNT
jgi:hypothetical protein